ncbi:putrescine/proton symporter [Escherichia coli]|nr:putrescine/proton symporter [Escherichia coli]
MLPTKLAEVGTISIISWLITAVGSMALAVAFAKCGNVSRHTGGMGGYADKSVRKAGSFRAKFRSGVSLARPQIRGYSVCCAGGEGEVWG